MDTAQPPTHVPHAEGAQTAQPAAQPSGRSAPTRRARRAAPKAGPSAAPPPTLGEFAAQQLALEHACLAKGAAKASTVENWQAFIKALPATLTTMRLTAIRECDCATYVADLQAQHRAGTLAESTMETRLRFLRSLLQRARQAGLIDRNPCAAVLRAHRKAQGRGAGPREVTEAQTFTADQAVQVLIGAACVVPPLFFVLVAVMLLTGLLGGEARALQLGDLQLDYVCGGVRRPRIWVRRIEFHGTLSLAGWEARYVDVPPSLEALLRWWIATRGLTQPTDWLFPGPLPRPGSRRAMHVPKPYTDWCVPTETLHTYWRRILAHALPGVQRSMTALRHAYCTISLQLGEEVLYVSLQVGHRTVTYTRKVYRPWLELASQGTFTAASEALAAALEPALATAAEARARVRGQTPAPATRPVQTRRTSRATSSRL